MLILMWHVACGMIDTVGLVKLTHTSGKERGEGLGTSLCTV